MGQKSSSGRNLDCRNRKNAGTKQKKCQNRKKKRRNEAPKLLICSTKMVEIKKRLNL